MNTIAIVIIGVAIGGFVVFVCLWFLYTVFKTLVTLPLMYVANARGAAKVIIDERITGDDPDLLRLRQLIHRVRTYDPTPAPIVAPRPAQYRSMLGAIPVSKVPMFDIDDEMDFFTAELSQQGFSTVRRLTPNQQVSEEPFLEDFKVIQRPSDRTVRQVAEQALANKPTYDGEDLPGMAVDRVPELGAIPGKFDVPEPRLELPFWRGPLALLNLMVRSANETEIKRHDSAVTAWKDLRTEYDAAREDLKRHLLELQDRSAVASEARARAWRSASVEVAAGREQWEARKRREVELMQSVIDRWDNGFFDDPADMAKVALEFTLLPRWLPMAVEAAYDEESSILIVDVEFPDVGRIEWKRRLAEKVKPATKTESKEAKEKLYPALALRYAWEVARAVNDNLSVVR